MKNNDKTATEIIDIYKSYKYKILKNNSKEAIFEKKYGGTEEYRRFTRLIFIDKVLNSMRTTIDVRAIPGRIVPAKYKEPRQKDYKLKEELLIAQNDMEGRYAEFSKGISEWEKEETEKISSMIDENTLIHELIHMWFGNWVSLDSWGEIWRNEGFATYFAKSWLNRDNPNSYINYLEAVYLDTINRDDLNNLGDLPQNEMFGYESYVVGSLVAYKLNEEIGDEAFYAGLQDYFIIYGGSTASDADFQAVMEDACDCSLEDFFDFWLQP